MAQPVPGISIQRLRDLLVRSSSHCEEKRVGEYDLNIHAESLGIADTGGLDGRRPPVDRLVTALLTAAVIDVIGGIANAELLEDQVPIVAGLPGIVATMTDPWPAAYGSAQFLRAWVRQPGFRLLK
ncbi:DUF6368 family protein [Streptomyces longispororuber]|uniref:DUF6368 family protein n=1 Tax=Streptomyces longispororuber TaxID=68230 RepID=UPI00210CD7E4|nr:DUF6368 family protein [Streptomyces longispororuber]MCQ4213894.1 DUF6368 family protein [Streptomyces longispororuber]